MLIRVTLSLLKCWRRINILVPGNIGGRWITDILNDVQAPKYDVILHGKIKSYLNGCFDKVISYQSDEYSDPKICGAPE